MDGEEDVIWVGMVVSPKCMQKFSTWLQYCASSNNSVRIVSYPAFMHVIVRYLLR